MTLTPEEKAGCDFANQKLALAITPYFFNLIDRNDPNCPIRKQVIPRSDEMVVSEEEIAEAVRRIERACGRLAKAHKGVRQEAVG